MERARRVVRGAQDAVLTMTINIFVMAALVAATHGPFTRTPAPLETPTDGSPAQGRR